MTTAARSEAMPDIPTVSEFVPGFEASTWYGIGAPRNTPAEIINTLNTQINASLADPEVKARFAEVGMTVLPGLPDFQKLIADETDKWAKVIRAANIRAFLTRGSCCSASVRTAGLSVERSLSPPGANRT